MTNTVIRSLPYDSDEMEDKLAELVPCERPIIGPNQYLLAFADCDFRSIDVINHYNHLQGLSVVEAMQEVQPGYLLVDPSIELKLVEDFGAGGDMLTYYGLPEDQFRDFLDRFTALENVVYFPSHGTVQIRRVVLQNPSTDENGRSG